MSLFAFDASPDMSFAGSRLFVRNQPAIDVARVYQIFLSDPSVTTYNPDYLRFPDEVPNPFWDPFRGYTSRKVGLDFEQVGPGWNRVTLLIFGIDPTYDALGGFVAQQAHPNNPSSFYYDLFPVINFAAVALGLNTQESFPPIIANQPSYLSGNIIPVNTVPPSVSYVKDNLLKVVSMTVGFSLLNTGASTISWQPNLNATITANVILVNPLGNPYAYTPINETGYNPVCPFTLNGNPISLFYQAPVTSGFMVAVTSIIPDTQHREIEYSGTVTPII